MEFTQNMMAWICRLLLTSAETNSEAMFLCQISLCPGDINKKIPHFLLKSLDFNASLPPLLSSMLRLIWDSSGGDRSRAVHATASAQSVTICMVMCGRGGIMKFPACRLEGYPLVCWVIYLLCQEPGQPGLVLPHSPGKQESNRDRKKIERAEGPVCLQNMKQHT